MLGQEMLHTGLVGVNTIMMNLLAIEPKVMFQTPSLKCYG